MVQQAGGGLAATATAHDENLDRRVAFDPIVCALEPAVEPALAQLMVRRIAEHGLRPEVDLAQRCGAQAHGAVAPRADEQPHGGADALFHCLEVAGAGIDEGIVPAAGDQAGDIGVAIPVGRLVVAFECPPLVVLAAVVVVEERLFEMRGNRQRHLAGFEGHALQPLPCLMQAAVGDLFDRFGVVAELVGVEGVVVDGGVHVQRHGATLARLVQVDIGWALLGADRGQVRRAVQRGLGLDDGAVRAAHHPDLAIAPGLRGDPLDGVVAVFALPIVAGVIVAAVALGFVARADVLDDEDIAALYIPARNAVPLGEGLVVGVADQNSRPGAGAGGGRVDVGGQAHAIAHGDHHVGC